MNHSKTGKFYIFKENEQDFIKGNSLIFDCQLSISSQIDFMLKENLKKLHIRLEYHSIDEDENLSFIEDFSFIEAIHINYEIDDLSHLYCLKNLKSLSVEYPVSKIFDLSNYTNLEHLRIPWNKNIKRISNCHNLYKLELENFKSEQSILEFSQNTLLESLIIDKSSLSNLNGIEKLKNLSRLDLINVRKLESLKGIEYLNKLQFLYIYNSKLIEDFALIGDLVNLKDLQIRNCGNVSSISFAKKLNKLKVFIFGNNVIDGDISPCLNIEGVGFVDKPHYSHKMKEFNSPQGTFKNQ